MVLTNELEIDEMLGSLNKILEHDRFSRLLFLDDELDRVLAIRDTLIYVLGETK